MAKPWQKSEKHLRKVENQRAKGLRVKVSLMEKQITKNQQ